MKHIWMWITAFIHCGVTLFETNPRWQEIDADVCADQYKPGKRAQTTLTSKQINAVVPHCATPYKAAVWLMLQAGEAQMTDRRTNPDGVTVLDPVQQWRLLYHDTHVATLN